MKIIGCHIADNCCRHGCRCCCCRHWCWHGGQSYSRHSSSSYHFPWSKECFCRFLCQMFSTTLLTVSQWSAEMKLEPLVFNVQWWFWFSFVVPTPMIMSFVPLHLEQFFVGSKACPPKRVCCPTIFCCFLWLWLWSWWVLSCWLIRRWDWVPIVDCDPSFCCRCGAATALAIGLMYGLTAGDMLLANQTSPTGYVHPTHAGCLDNCTAISSSRIFWLKYLNVKDRWHQQARRTVKSKCVNGPVVQPTDEAHARCITNGYLGIKHDRGRCNCIGMISRGLLNKSSLFWYFILYIVWLD